MDKKVRIGVIGCGGIANGKHMPAEKRNPAAEMVAFCDIIEERAIKAREDFGKPEDKVYTDYKELLKERTQAQSARSEAGNAVTIGKEAQDLLDDMCALANASSLLQPSEEATKFIASITQVFKNARSAYKARAKGEDEEEENPDTEKPADEENPDTEQPGTEPPGEGTGEEETPNPDGQQPTEPQLGVDTDGDGSPEVV